MTQAPTAHEERPAPGPTALRRWAAPVAGALLPIVLALGVGALILLILGADPGAFYYNIIRRGLLSWIGLQDTITRCAPLLLLGASLIVAFRAGLWNLGVDGQFLLAAVFAAALAPALVTVLPVWLVLPLVMVVAMAVGAVWSLVPAVLKAYHGVNEIVTTLMMSFWASARRTSSSSCPSTIPPPQCRRPRPSRPTTGCRGFSAPPSMSG